MTVTAIEVLEHHCVSDPHDFSALANNGVSTVRLHSRCEVCGQRWIWTYHLSPGGSHSGEGKQRGEPSRAWRRRMASLFQIDGGPNVG